jgi:hypothetical protein
MIGSYERRKRFTTYYKPAESYGHELPSLVLVNVIKSKYDNINRHNQWVVAVAGS